MPQIVILVRLDGVGAFCCGMRGNRYRQYLASLRVKNSLLEKQNTLALNILMTYNDFAIKHLF